MNFTRVTTNWITEIASRRNSTFCGPVEWSLTVVQGLNLSGCVFAFVITAGGPCLAGLLSFVLRNHSQSACLSRSTYSDAFLWFDDVLDDEKLATSPKT